MSEPSLNLGGPKNTTIRSSSISTATATSNSSQSQSNSIQKKTFFEAYCNDSSASTSNSLESTEKDNGLDSLTVAASVICSRQNTNDKSASEQLQKVPPAEIPKQPQSHPPLPSKSPISISKAPISLPSLAKVFPEHFGGPANVSTHSLPARLNQSKNGLNYAQLQNQNNLSSKQFKQVVTFGNGNYPLNSIYSARNSSIDVNVNFYNSNANSINYGNLNHQHHQDPRLFFSHPQLYTQAQADRKRSFHQQGPSSVSDLISPPRSMRPQIQAQSRIPHNQSQALNFSSYSLSQNYNTHSNSHSRNSSLGSIQSSSQNSSCSNQNNNLNSSISININNQFVPTIIQNKLNFRNFALQLSSKSTNLTSNQAGTAAADKQHFAAIMQDCVIVSSVDYINSFRNYRPTVNNKLKPLKFNEYIQEQLHFRYSPDAPVAGVNFTQTIPAKDDLVYFYKTPETFLQNNSSLSRFKIFRHSRSLGIAVYRSGQRIFPVSPEDIADFWTGVPRNIPLQSKERSFDNFQDDDLVLICRGYPENLYNEADSLAEDISKVQPGGDLDDALPPQGHVFDYLLGETATVVAILGSEFDDYILKGTNYRIKHVIHVEKNGHTAIDDPWPYAITKHTLVQRPYLAMLFSDASKINRFSPTIEFVIKKAMTAPIGESILKSLGKLSEIQHMAGAMVIGDKLRYWATGGAVLAVLSRANSKSVDWDVKFPGLITWTSSSFDSSYTIAIGETDIKSGDCILLCCPEIRHSWKEAELISIIKSRAVWPEKFQILTNRFKKERNSKNGLGLFEIVLK